MRNLTVVSSDKSTILILCTPTQFLDAINAINDFMMGENVFFIIYYF